MAQDSFDMPPLIATTRDTYMSRASVWITLPSTRCCASFASTPAREGGLDHVRA